MQGKSKEKVVALKEINIAEKKADGNASLDDAVREGEFLMLRGPSGCGKTTLLNIIGTIDKLTSGKLSTQR